MGNLINAVIDLDPIPAAALKVIDATTPGAGKFYTDESWQTPSGAAAMNITDGVTTVTGVTDLTITGAATLTDDGGGAATLDIPGGGGTSLRTYPINRPTLSDFTPTNLGGSDTYGTYADGSIWFRCQANTGLNARLLVKPYTIPSAGHTYTLVMAMQNSMPNEDYFEQGIVLYDSGSGKLTWFGVRGSTDNIPVTFGMSWEEWVSLTSTGSGSERTNRRTVYRSEAIWIKFTDDGTTQSVYSSPDGCDNSWLLHGSAGSTAWNTADHIGLWNMPYEPSNYSSSNYSTLIVPSWLETTT